MQMLRGPGKQGNSAQTCTLWHGLLGCVLAEKVEKKVAIRGLVGCGHQDVIHIYKSALQIMEDCVYKALKGLGCIAETKGLQA